MEPPHWSQFKLLDREHNILLRGTPDGMLLCRKGGMVIVDYKTAKFSSTQDALLPMYEVQLNVYAAIANRLGLGPVEGLALIYMEPLTELEAGDNSRCGRGGFDMGFEAQIVPVGLNPALMPPLLVKVRQLIESLHPPAGAEGCRDCPRIKALARTVNGNRGRTSSASRRLAGCEASKSA